MRDHSLKRLLSASEVAETLGISRRRFETLISEEGGPPYLTIGRMRKWTPEDVKSWVRASVSREAKSRARRSGETSGEQASEEAPVST